MEPAASSETVVHGQGANSNGNVVQSSKDTDGVATSVVTPVALDDGPTEKLCADAKESPTEINGGKPRF